MTLFSTLKHSVMVLGVLISAALAAPTHAGADLTTVGAEQGGNAEGTIPEWTGGITKTPAGYSPGDRHPDPFAEDQSLFTIDHASMREYAENLSAGHLALLEQFPSSFRIVVYPSRRSASHPEHVLDSTNQYKSQARIVDNGAGLEGSVIGIPFPQPENGEQAIWNTLTSYKGGGVRRHINSATVNGKGKYTLSKAVQEVVYPRQTKGITLDSFDGVLVRGINTISAPRNAAGTMALYHVPLNTAKGDRNAWIYVAKKRRVSRTPNLEGSAPAAVSNGVHLIDQNGMFSGKITDFNWSLKGKKELYVPYNAYRLHSEATTPKDIIQPGHINSDLARYELHRVWVIEAIRKSGIDHPHQRRIYYADEDSWRILLAEHYDDRGTLDRFSESHTINYYEVPVLAPTLETHYQMGGERYFVSGLDNQDEVNDYTFHKDAGYFQPNSLKRKAKR